MKEWHKTVLFIILLALGFVFMMWTRAQYGLIK